MQHDSPEDNPHDMQISIVGKSKTDTLQETVNFLYDFNVAYEMARLASDERYDQFSFSHYVWMRNGRPLDREARLRVVKLQETSPIELITAIGVISVSTLTSIWLLLQIVEKAYNVPLNRRKLRAETEKAERENKLATQTTAAQEPEHRAGVVYEDSQASPFLQSVTRRLSKSTVIISDITIRYENVDQKAGSA